MDQSADFYRKNQPSLWIETSKGKQFHFNDPKFDIEEIAHATSMQCRYTGHCRRFYSVAEHSLLVCLITEQLGLGDPFEALMHDAQEAYLSDIAAPWKAMLPDYKIMENALESKLRANYGLPPHISEGVKRADWIALFVEARHLIPSKGKDWICPEGVREAAVQFRDIHITGYEPHIARDHFLVAFAELGGPRGFQR